MPRPAPETGDATFGSPFGAVVPTHTSQTGNSNIIAILMDQEKFRNGENSVNLGHALNPQRLASLNAKTVSDNTSPGVGLDGEYRDPWGNPYQYLNPGVRGEIDVFSFGADGVAGGERFDADVGSWGL